MPVRITIYEDNDMLRESISGLVQLSDRLAFLAAFGDPVNILDDIQQHKPDMILMDIEMPNMDGIQAVAKIRSHGITTPVIMLTVFEDNDNVLNAIKAGASGYLLKKHISTKLLQSIEEVLEGGAPMSPSIAKMVIASMQLAGKETYQLTGKEKEVLASLSKGNSYKMIAAHLAISIETVRSHIKRIYEKLHVNSQTEAVSKAINERLV